MLLQAGRFYKSRAGDVWCCYRSISYEAVHCVLTVGTGRIESFFADGRYDVGGKREHCLVEECDPTGKPLEVKPTVSSLDLDDLAREAHRIAIEHGFTEATIGEDLMLMVTELAEAMEDVRAGRDPTVVWYEERYSDRVEHKYHSTYQGRRPIVTTQTTVVEYSDMIGAHPVSGNKVLRKPCGIPSELADVIIRILHFSGKHKVPLAQAVREKMAYNESRPFKHGGKTV
jgi:hypothetical protein